MANDTKKLFTFGATGILMAAIIIAFLQIQLSQGYGTLTILVTDPPEWGPATHVYVNITKIEIHKADSSEESGWTLLSEEKQELNLTDILDTEEVLLNAELGTGKYNIIRFEIESALITIDNENHNESALVSSGNLTLTIIQGGITIEEGDESTLLVDIETRVVYSNEKGYLLVPAAKAIPIRE